MAAAGRRLPRAKDGITPPSSSKKRKSPASGSSLASPMPKLSHGRGGGAHKPSEQQQQEEVEGEPLPMKNLISVPSAWPRLSVDLPTRASPSGDSMEDGARSAEIH